MLCEDYKCEEHKGGTGERGSHLVAPSSFVSVTGPHHENVGHGSEGGKVLHRLVSGAVLSQTNGVVGHHKDGASLQGARASAF